MEPLSSEDGNVLPQIGQVSVYYPEFDYTDIYAAEGFNPIWFSNTDNIEICKGE